MSVRPSICLSVCPSVCLTLPPLVILLLFRYIHTDNIDKRLEYCSVAASLLKVKVSSITLPNMIASQNKKNINNVTLQFQALFSSSLPLPTANFDFALYDIGEGLPVGSLIPGVNLFSDPFRCDAKVLLTSTVWLVEELVETRNYLMVGCMLSFLRPFYMIYGIPNCFGAWIT